MPSVKKLNVFVIMCGERGYYSTRTGGSAFREDPVDFTLFRNYTNAERLIRREVKILQKHIEIAEDRNLEWVQTHYDNLAEWEKAEVVKVVD